MSNTPADRPSSLKRPVRAAADEQIDPVDYTPPVTIPTLPAVSSAPAVAAVPRRAGRPARDPSIPFSTRLSLEIVELLDAAKATGEAATIRDAVEEAVRAKYGHLAETSS